MILQTTNYNFDDQEFVDHQQLQTLSSAIICRHVQNKCKSSLFVESPQFNSLPDAEEQEDCRQEDETEEGHLCLLLFNSVLVPLTKVLQRVFPMNESNVS